MLKSFILLGFGLLPSLVFGLKTVATVNRQPIYAYELEAITDSSHQTQEKLERLVLFHLAVQEAKVLKLDQKPEVRTELLKVLYRAYLEDSLSKQNKQLRPTQTEIKKAYEKTPLIRVRQIVLQNKSPEQKKQAKENLQKITKQYRLGTPFEKLALSFSQDATIRSGGDLGYRGVHNLPKPAYSQLLTTKPNSLSAPLRKDGKIYVFERGKNKAFDKAPETYIAMLRGTLQRQNEQAFLDTQLKQLRKKAKVEIQYAR